MHYDPMEKHLELMRHAPRAMKYDGSVPFEQWQEAARQKLAELLGLPLEMPESDEFHIEYDEEREDFREIRFTFASEPLADVCCYLLLPKEYEGRLPMVICLQGHTKGCHISLGRVKYEGDELKIGDGDRDFGLQVGTGTLLAAERAGGLYQVGSFLLETKENMVSRVRVHEVEIGIGFHDEIAVEARQPAFPLIDTADG